MKTEWKDVAKLYVGIEVKTESGGILKMTGVHIDDFSWTNEAVVLNGNVTHTTRFDGIKPILRPLSDMTVEEASDFAISCMKDGNYYLDEDSKIEDDEIQIDLHKDDGGNMLDADVEICIEVSVRCFVGFLLIKKDGSISIEDEDGHLKEPVGQIASKVNYLLSKSFDLFGLIESNQAISRTTLTDKK